MRVFIGAVDDNEQRLIKSIERYCQGMIDINILRGGNIGAKKFAVPDFCVGEGRAVYIDSNYVLNADLQELFDLIPKDGIDIHPALAYRTEVMMFDCSKKTCFTYDCNQNAPDTAFVQYYMEKKVICFGRWPEWNRDRLTDDAKLYRGG